LAQSSAGALVPRALCRWLPPCPMVAAARDPVQWDGATARAMANLPTSRVLTSHPPASAPSGWETGAGPADPGGALPSPHPGRMSSAPADSRPPAHCALATVSVALPAERPAVDAMPATTLAMPEVVDGEPTLCDGCSTRTLPAAPWGAEPADGCSTQTVAAWQPPVAVCADAGASPGCPAGQGWVAAPTLVFGGGGAAGPLPVATTAERPGFAVLAGVHEQALVPTEVGAPVVHGALRQLPPGAAVVGATTLCCAPALGRQLSRQASSASTASAAGAVRQASARVLTTTICVPGAAGAITSTTKTATSFVLAPRVVFQAPVLSDCGPRKTCVELEPKTGRDEHERIKQIARPNVAKKSRSLCC